MYSANNFIIDNAFAVGSKTPIINIASINFRLFNTIFSYPPSTLRRIEIISRSPPKHLKPSSDFTRTTRKTSGYDLPRR